MEEKENIEKSVIIEEIEETLRAFAKYEKKIEEEQQNG